MRVFFTLLWLCLSIVQGLAETRELVILHTNDIHGYVEAYEGGGLEKIAGLVAEYRERYPGQVVLLDGGDTSLGTPLSGIFHGIPAAEIMDLMNYDAVVLGNHEFNWGKQKMRVLTGEINAPVVCANLVESDGSDPPYAPWTVVERNGVRLGVVGLVTADTPRKAPVDATAGWNFLEPASAVEASLSTLPEVDAILCLTHLGLAEDEKLALAVPEIDLIVGGHSHTPLPEPAVRNHTPIVQAGCYAQFLGVLRVLVDTEKNSLEVVEYRLVPAREAARSDPAAHGIVEKYAAELRPILSRQVATVSEHLDKHAPDHCFDTPLGNYVSDVFRRRTGADVALYNRAGVRYSLHPGPLTVGRVFELFPFDDPVTVLEASGEELWRVLEQGTVDGEGPLSASGLTAVIVEGEVSEVEVNGKPLDLDAVYTIATTRFLADGGDGMATLSGLARLKTLPFTRDVLLAELETNSVINSPGTGRLIIKGRRENPNDG